MNQPKPTFLIAAFYIFCFSSVSFAQNPPPKSSEPSFEVVLRTIVATNEATGKTAVPPPLATVIKKLKGDFSFVNYRLTSTFMQRVSNNGNIELKSIAYETNKDKNFPIFSEWTLDGLQSLLDESGRERFQMQSFRFGQRVSVISDSGAVNYGQIGLTTRFSLPKNVPTVVGSLTNSKPDELIFIILTVKLTEK